MLEPPDQAIAIPVLSRALSCPQSSLMLSLVILTNSAAASQWRRRMPLSGVEQCTLDGVVANVFVEDFCVTLRSLTCIGSSGRLVGRISIIFRFDPRKNPTDPS